MNFYDFIFKDVTGKEIHFSDFKGKVCLVVNIASACGYTPQLHDLQALYLLYKEKGLVVLAFPSNDFGQQEPLSNEGIEQTCRQKFLTTFPVFEKSHVRGKEANDIFRFLSSRKLNHRFNSRPMWNFHKYLVDRNGNVADYFFTFTKPRAARFRKAIDKLLR